ncbi:hypothetical protein H6P81_011262 [Aristolochia fimbriata]|uniref:Uncharacterized protein n=1 Tax=Aristolochia fimbriata TaxID=158543 RepID=A0AAV7ER00_ARIFI|nr:hypothetical protein H6P81_011262 [Aristolochia fimbriata]
MEEDTSAEKEVHLENLFSSQMCIQNRPRKGNTKKASSLSSPTLPLEHGEELKRSCRKAHVTKRVVSKLRSLDDTFKVQMVGFLLERKIYKEEDQRSTKAGPIHVRKEKNLEL